MSGLIITNSVLTLLSVKPSKYASNTPPHAELSIVGVPLSFVPEAKFLGVWLQHNLQGDKNIYEISKKANQKLFIL